MKNIVKYTLILIALLTVSCKDFLDEDPKTLMSPDKTFASPQAFKLLANGIYAADNGAYHDNPDNIFLMCMPADDICSDRSEWDWEQSDRFTQSDGISRYDNDTWKMPFRAIVACNGIIDGYDQVPVKNDAEQALVNNVAGQAYFYRAHWLLFMSKFWGPIPMTLHNDGSVVKKSNVNDIFDQGIADLQKAEELLPELQTESDWISYDGFSMTPLKFAAKAWLAQAYLQSTGWPLFRTENYAKAAQKAKEVIDWANAHPTVLGLLPLDELNSGQGFWNKECVWGRGHTFNGDYTMKCSMGETPDEEVTGTGWATNLAEIKFFNDFPEGKRKEVTFRTTIWIEPNTDELKAELAALQATLSKAPGGSFGPDWPVRRWNGLRNNVTPNQCRYTWYNFNPDTDLAAGKFFWDERYRRWNVQVTWDDYIKNPDSRRHPYYAKYYFDDEADHTYVPSDRKYNADGSIDAWGWETRSLDAEFWRTGKLVPFMRYAEVLLIYAEAQAMANGLDQSCIDALNQVRARAEETRGLAKLGDYASKEDFQRAMFDERGWELCGLEMGNRWADLLRFERAKEMNSFRPSLGNWPDGRPKEKEINSEFFANEKKFYYLLIPAPEKQRTGFRDNDASVDPINPPEVD
ncbi:MAG: RagB/SusD family nutrient uptake outer membrane protein [Tannerella sp.]|jgi:hypothetical protein|nr:RagB/SusD family nutrient uptake outer membrane protein [Tannerella sp.]